MIATSPDGQWAVIRRGRDVALYANGAGPATSRIALDTDEVDLVLVGPPTLLVAVMRGTGNRVVLHAPPYLDAVARLDLDAPMHLAAVTGARMALVSQDGKSVSILRAAGRALSVQTIDPGSPVEFAVGLDRNQLLLSLLKKLEVWDAVSGRPLLRMQLQLPPPPRSVGPAHGHLWATRGGSDEVFVYRLSDGRPFRHHAGSPIHEVIWNAASPVLVLVTERGLIRLHCFAHSLTAIEAPWRPGCALAQLVVGDDIQLLGLADEDAEPWRVAIGGTPVTAGTDEPAAPRPVPERPSEPARSAAPPSREPERATPRARAWREPLAALGAELARGAEAELPIIAVDTELGELAHRLALPTAARRALIALYALYLVGDPGPSIARLAQILGDWTEPLGQGELAQLAMLRRRGGRVTLRACVTDLLDGAGPRAIRIVGRSASAPQPGVTRLPRDGQSDAAIETLLAERLGRIAVIEGGAALGVLEARLHGATAVALSPPLAPPLPWPREAGLVVVADGAPPAWVAALPLL